MGNKKQGEQALTYIVVGIYFLILCWAILFKFAVSIDEIPSMRALNLIPFHYDQLSGSRFHSTEVLENALVFIPAGFYFTEFLNKKPWPGILACAALSLCFETLQYVFAIGSSDITDVITNTIGGVLGTGLYLVLGKLFKGRQVRIISITGAVLEIVFIGLMILLAIANS